MQATADPFAKVKGLIQKLIERLVHEATQEATKKGFCDKSLAEARKDHKHRVADVNKYNALVLKLEVKEDKLVEEIDDLTTDIADITAALRTATELRDDEKVENLETIKTAKEGHGAVTEALAILHKFYKQAAKAAFLQKGSASPVDEDTSGPGFSSTYQGNQSGSKGVIGLLEVIQSDFDRTIRTTTADEKKAQADFILFERTSKADLSGKGTKKTLNERDLTTTRDKKVRGMKDLESNMALADAAIKELEDLKPTCIDTGMSYADRVAKREEEIAALKVALCQLDAEGVEDECR